MTKRCYYFISGLPRSGSTLLSAILRQNPEFYADITSPVQGIVENTIDFITGCENNFNIMEEHRKNILLSIFEGYYSNIQTPVIFDSSRSWTKNTTLLKKLFNYTKILCCVRDIPWIINSFEIILNKNCFYTKKLNEQILSGNISVRSNEIFNRNIIDSINFLREGFSINPEMIYFVEYDNLCKNPEKEMKTIYKFLNKSYYPHDFENLQYSNENFDKFCNLKNLHTVRKKVEYKEQKKVLPPELWQRYENMNIEFWKKEYNLCSDTIKNPINNSIWYQ